MELLTVSNNKTLKSIEFGFHTGILHLAPFTLSGKNVCPKASNGCASACLNTSGHGAFSNVQKARKDRTLMYFNEREEFLLKLERDIFRIQKQAVKKNLKPALRLNGTSDLPALAIKFAKKFPAIQMYDYTKIAKTFEKELPENYHLTFSRSETNENECLEILAKGYNVAMVFAKVPKTYKGYKVVDGDIHDLRFLDEKGVIVGLKAKGKARKDDSGFVIQ